MTLQLHDLSLDGLDVVADGKPLLLPVESIDEDPDQPRVEFDAESLRELASTIAERGVRQPISVRSHPETPGRWRLNFGARRLRASKVAGRLSIPAFVDETADQYDQVIENEQRDRLTPLEMSLFIARRLRAGESQAEVARRLGKSRQYVTLATALIDAPDWLMTTYREGRCRGLNELYELRRLNDKHPGAVAEWVVSRSGVTRGDLDTLRDQLAAGSGDADPTERRETPSSSSTASVRTARAPSTTFTGSRFVLIATLDGAEVEVLLQRSAAAMDQIVVRHLQDGRPFATAAAALQNLRLGLTCKFGQVSAK